MKYPQRVRSKKKFYSTSEAVSKATEATSDTFDTDLHKENHFFQSADNQGLIHWRDLAPEQLNPLWNRVKQGEPVQIYSDTVGEAVYWVRDEALAAEISGPPFAADRLEALAAQRLIYHLPKPDPDGRTQLILSPLELIGRLAALVPRPGNTGIATTGTGPQLAVAPAVTALAPHAVAPTSESRPAVATAADEPVDTIQRSPARYLWAMLLARLFDAFPLLCPKCGAEMRIIAFITEGCRARDPRALGRTALTAAHRTGSRPAAVGDG